MPDQNINAFAKALVRLVRDRAIQNCRARLSPDTRSPVGKRWIEVLRNTKLDEVVDTIITDSIDEAIFCLLNAIDEEGIKLSFIAPDGAMVDLSSEGLGELAGWYMGVENWRERFSEEKINNYLA